MELGKRTDEGTLIGRSSAGTKWVCYWTGEDAKENMRKVLLQQWEHSTETVRVRGLTDNQVDHIYWANKLYCEGMEIPEEVCSYGRTYVDAPKQIIKATLERLEGDLDDVDCGSFDGPTTRAQRSFAYERKKKSLESTIEKIEKALA